MSDEIPQEPKDRPKDRFVTHPGRDRGITFRKRFYSRAGYRAVGTGYAIELDGRAVKTPAKQVLIVPTERLAEAVAGEWDAQGEHIDPTCMLLTKLANTAVDRVVLQRAHVEDEIAAFARTDLLCYRAQAPAELAARQMAAWQPVLDWAETRFGGRMVTTSGLMAVDQAGETIAVLRHAVALCDDFALAGLHNAVCLTGSLILGLAVLDRHLTPARAFELAHLDENWQAEQWGRDEEEMVRYSLKADELARTALFLKCVDWPA